MRFINCRVTFSRAKKEEGRNRKYNRGKQPHTEGIKRIFRDCFAEFHVNKCKKTCVVKKFNFTQKRSGCVLGPWAILPRPWVVLFDKGVLVYLGAPHHTQSDHVIHDGSLGPHTICSISAGSGDQRSATWAVSQACD